jgi:hypothetical protein
MPKAKNGAFTMKFKGRKPSSTTKTIKFKASYSKLYKSLVIHFIHAFQFILVQKNQMKLKT